MLLLCRKAKLCKQNYVYERKSAALKYDPILCILQMQMFASALLPSSRTCKVG